MATTSSQRAYGEPTARWKLFATAIIYYNSQYEYDAMWFRLRLAGGSMSSSSKHAASTKTEENGPLTTRRRLFCIDVMKYYIKRHKILSSNLKDRLIAGLECSLSLW